MAYILHIDTSSAQAVIAVSHNGKCLHQRTSDDTRNHAAAINLLIDDVLSQSNIAFRDLQAVCVIGGPGSYTGLRIGLATAKAYCYTLDLPLIMINKLDLLALQYIGGHEVKHNYYLTKLLARAGEYFICLYNKDGKQILPPQHVAEDALPEIFREYGDKLAIIGQASGDIVPEAAHVTYYENEQVDIRFWSEYAFELFNCNSFVSLASSEPFYLKQVYTHNKL